MLREIIQAAHSETISPQEALLLATPEMLRDASYDRLDTTTYGAQDCFSSIGTPGVGTGRAVYSRHEAEQAISNLQPYILWLDETNSEDMHVLLHPYAKGIVTRKGGITSHAAMIALQHGIPSVIGVGDTEIEGLRNGDIITIEGQHGVIRQGAIAPIIAQKENPDIQALVAMALDMEHTSPHCRPIRIRAIADTAEEVSAAVARGADGTGLCRTENNFFQEDRLEWFQQLILAQDEQHRTQALVMLKQYEKEDFKRIFRASDGKEVRIRLMDAPLNEFMPSEDAESEEIERLSRKLGISTSALESSIHETKEHNPMLGGKRAVRLGISRPEIYRAQAQAFFEAAAEVTREGIDIKPALFVPLVSFPTELEFVKNLVMEEKAHADKKYGQEIPFRFGMMAEIPSACLSMGRMARHLDFISCGMNDLTQTTHGLSRDDTSQEVALYLRQGLLKEDPFQSVTEEVAEMIAIAAQRGKAANPLMEVSVCGAQTIPTDSMQRCYTAGVEFVSVEMPLIEQAIIQSARVALMQGRSQSRNTAQARRVR